MCVRGVHGAVTVARARARAFCATLRYLRRPTRSPKPQAPSFVDPVVGGEFVVALVASPALAISPRYSGTRVENPRGRTTRVRGESAAARSRGRRFFFPAAHANRLKERRPAPCATYIFVPPWKSHVTYAVSIDLGDSIGDSGRTSRNAATGTATDTADEATATDPLAAFREVMAGRSHVTWLHPSCTKLFPCLSLPWICSFFSLFFLFFFFYIYLSSLDTVC